MWYSEVNFRRKIVILILVQISIIISSFLITACLEAEKILAGHTINAAGKNRVLASQVEVEMHRLAFGKDASPAITDKSEALGFKIDSDTVTTLASGNIFDKLEALRTNIYSIKQDPALPDNGVVPTPFLFEKKIQKMGEIPDEGVLPMAPRFNDDWQGIADVYDVYYDSIVSLVSEREFTLEDIEETMRVGDDLILRSDILTAKLSDELESFSFQIVVLQIVLGIINVVTHVFLIWMIVRIFKKHAEEKSKKEKFATLGEFAAILAHDMRNPLGTIYNSAKLISKNVKDSKGKTEMDRIDRSINRMSRQIDGVLNYLKEPKLELGSYSIKEMLKASINDIEMPGSIEISLPTDDVTIYCDGKKLEFVFTNLILNAVQAIGGNSGYITISMKEDTPDHIKLSFEDSGEALPEPTDTIFQPLYTTKMHGTGLGLTSCRNIMQAHNGTISARNNPVTFTLTLPKGAGLKK